MLVGLLARRVLWEPAQLLRYMQNVRVHGELGAAHREHHDTCDRLRSNALERGQHALDLGVRLGVEPFQGRLAVRADAVVAQDGAHALHLHFREAATSDQLLGDALRRIQHAGPRRQALLQPREGDCARLVRRVLTEDRSYQRI